MRRLLLVVSLSALASFTLSLAACEQKPKYDDAPIARDDRKKKAPEPPETFDRDAICSQLVDLPGPAVDAPLRPELREMCRTSLGALQSSRPDDYACRCRCIKGAGDLFAVERCVRFCSADDPKRVCEHFLGVEETTNDAGVLDDKRDACVEKLKRLHDKDLSVWSCTVRCYVGATSKEDGAACDSKCSSGGVGAPSAKPIDAGAPETGKIAPEIEY